MKRLITLFMVVILSSAIFAVGGINKIEKKKTFKGTVTYDITYSDDVDNMMKAQLPKSMTVKILGSNSITEYPGMPQSVMTKGDSKTVYTLMDFSLYGLGKYALKTTQADIDEAKADSEVPETTVQFSEETKEICAYTCQKAVLSVYSEDAEEPELITCWYSSELGGENINFGTAFSKIPGLLMEYTQYNPGFEGYWTMKAKEVKKGKVSSKSFLLPEGFEVKTAEELQELLKTLQ